MKKVLKFIGRYGIGFILGVILSFAIGAKASTTFVLDSTEVEYDNTLSGAAATTVKQALDYLNTKADALLAEQNSGSGEYQAYAVGDPVEYGGEGYHVIAASGTNQDYVTLLKDDPLTVTEIEAAGVTVAVEENGIGAVTYGEDSVYSTSNIKLAVEHWAGSTFTDELKEVDGYNVRLITSEELTALGCMVNEEGSCNVFLRGEYNYWTMSDDLDGSYVYVVESIDVAIDYQACDVSHPSTVRPVINLKKSALES